MASAPLASFWTEITPLLFVGHLNSPACDFGDLELTLSE